MAVEMKLFNANAGVHLNGPTTKAVFSNAPTTKGVHLNAPTTAALWIILIFGFVLVAGCSSAPPTVKPTPTAAAGRAAQSGESVIADAHVVPVTSAALSFPLGGIVKKVTVALGDDVKAGAVIAQLDDSILQKQIAQAQTQVDIARQQQAQAESQVELAQKQLAEVKTGASVGEIAAAQAALDAATANYAKLKQGPSADELGQLKANLDNAKASVDQAQAAYDRAGGASNPFIAQTAESLQLQQATNSYKAALAAYNEARSHPSGAELAAANAQIEQAQSALEKLTPTQAAIDVAQAQVDAAQAAVALAKSQIAGAQAAVDAAQAQATNYVLIAPFAGTVMSLDIDEGEYAAPGSVVVRLADTSNWRIETTDLTELNIVNVTEGTPVTATFDAVPGLELAGRVSRITPFGDTKQGDIVYTVIVTPDQQDPRLRWNMTAKVTIETKQ